MPKLTLGLRLDETGGVGSGTRTPTNCMLLTQHPTNANVIGYSSDFLNGGAEAYGTMIPNTTADGTLIYSYEIDHSTGLFVLKFGEDAATQLNNVSTTIIYHNADNANGDVLFVWDDINKWYSSTEPEKATNIKAYLGEFVCLSATPIPRVLIWYDFETMLVDGEEDYVPPSPATFEMFTTSSTPNPFEVTFRSPVGTSLSINEVVYEGNDDVDVVASVSWGNVGDRIPFLESIEGSLILLYFYENQLAGVIPDLSDYTNLLKISCRDNQLAGTIPSIINNINLEDFVIGTNQLTGTIPDLSNNVNLVYLQCHENQLTGTIPDLSNNVNMVYFYCRNNQLVGTIPDLSNNVNLQVFTCRNNQLTDFEGGTISVFSSFYANDNLLTELAVDGILQGLVDGNTTGVVTIHLETGNAAPSTAGEANVDILRGRGCTVTVEGGY